MKNKQLDELVRNVDPKAKVPRGFALWSERMIVMWLKQHQKKTRPRSKD